MRRDKVDKPSPKLKTLFKKSISDLTKFAATLHERQRKLGFNSSRKWVIDQVEEAIMAKGQEAVGVNYSAPVCFAEESFSRRATAAGWNVTKRGWPDFLCWRGDELVMVEVKFGKDVLSSHQRMVTELLSKAGIKCYEWRTDTGFRLLHPELHKKAKAEARIEEPA